MNGSLLSMLNSSVSSIATTTASEAIASVTFLYSSNALNSPLIMLPKCALSLTISGTLLAWTQWQGARQTCDLHSFRKISIPYWSRESITFIAVDFNVGDPLFTVHAILSKYCRCARTTFEYTKRAKSGHLANVVNTADCSCAEQSKLNRRGFAGAAPGKSSR
jgi:hypothetical protein